MSASGERNGSWNGGKTEINGYIGTLRPEHPRANLGGYEHILVVEAAIRHHLPVSAKVHHINENRRDNRPRNLVACEDQAYHSLLHRRLRVLRAGGRPGRDKICGRCQRAKSREEFYAAPSRKDGLYYYCRACARAAKVLVYHARMRRTA